MDDEKPTNLEFYLNKKITLFTISGMRFSGNITDIGPLFITFIDEYNIQHLIALKSIERIKK